MNTREKNFTPAKLKTRIEQVAEHIAGYLQELDTADRLEGNAAETRERALNDKIAVLRAQMQALRPWRPKWRSRPMARFRRRTRT